MRKMKWKRTVATILTAAMMFSVVNVPGSVANAAEYEWAATDKIANGDFETDYTTGWTADETTAAAITWKKDGSNNTTNLINLWAENAIEGFSLSQEIALEAGSYKLAIQISGAEAESGLGLSVYNGDKTIATSKFPATTGWDNYTTEELEFTLDAAATVTVAIDGDIAKGYWGNYDNVVLYQQKEKAAITKDDLQKLVDSVPLDGSLTFADTATVTGKVEAAKKCIANADATDAEIAACYNELLDAITELRIQDDSVFVKKIDGISDDAIRGMDVSSYLSLMKSFDEINEGKEESEKVGFRDFDGNLLDAQGFFDFLAAQGVNYIRLRVWNDPYDADGNGYGGGNNDLAAAKEMGQWATKAGMKVLIDFHYSDFWADPGKQKAPKAWADYTVDEKAEALGQFTYDSLRELLEAGVDVSMVQVGNETNGALCGETKWENLDVLFDAGCDAVHKVAEEKNTEILAAVHFTNPEKSGRQAGYAANLANYDGDGDGEKEGVSYDVFATSWYPYWHGSLENLQSVLGGIAKQYDKYVMVAETSWANTLKDADGHDNTVRVGNNDSDNAWTFSVQGQVNEFRDVLAAISDIDVTLENGDKAGLGAFYWEGAWIAVQNAYNDDGTLNETVKASNQKMWEKYGSGWAASYASEYDPTDAGKWYGGSAVDNQAFFDADGNALASIKVFNKNLLKYGAVSTLKIEGYTTPELTLEVGQTVDDVLPETVTIQYNNDSTEDLAVTWNADDQASVNEKAATNEGIGEYTIKGTIEAADHYAVTCRITVNPKNLLVNAGFETYADDGKPESWTKEGTGLDKQASDPRNGKASYHWYSQTAGTFKTSQNVTLDKPGIYKGTVYVQGATGEKIALSVEVGGQTYQGDEVSCTGWADWQQATISEIVVTQDMIDGVNNIAQFTINGTVAEGGWGSLDDAYFYWDEEVNQQETPALAIDYENETLVNQKSGVEYEYYYMEDEEKVPVTLEDDSVLSVMGKTLYITAKGDDSLLDSNAQKLVIPERPQASKTVSAVNETVKGKKDGKITGVTTAMEYKLVAAAEWTTCKADALTGLAPGKYEVRIKATEAAFASDAVEVTVAEGKADSQGTDVKPGTTEKENKNEVKPGTAGTDTQTGSKYVVTASGNDKTVEYTGTTGNQSTVVIPDTITIDGVKYNVTSIKADAFKNNKKIKKVTIGKNVKTIGANAFSGASKLKTVTMNKTVTTIGDKAFYNCKKLTRIVIPATVTKIGKQAFYNCKALKSITIKSTKLTSSRIGSKAFKGIHKKATIKVPKKKVAAYKKILKKKGIAKTVKVKK